MPKPFSRKCSQLVRRIVCDFSKLYEDEGDLDVALVFLQEELKNQNYLVKNHAAVSLKKKYPELDL